jgi:hypothetical protein
MRTGLLVSIRFLAVAGAAIAVGLGVLVVEAIATNRLLTATIGEAGILAIDDTLVWNVMGMAESVVAIGAGLAVFTAGWRRILRRHTGT